MRNLSISAVCLALAMTVVAALALSHLSSNRAVAQTRTPSFDQNADENGEDESEREWDGESEYEHEDDDEEDQEEELEFEIAENELQTRRLEHSLDVATNEVGAAIIALDTLTELAAPELVENELLQLLSSTNNRAVKRAITIELMLIQSELGKSKAALKLARQLITGAE